MINVKFEGPFYGCSVPGCSTECCYTADMLRVHEGSAWCEGCWDEAPVRWVDDNCEECIEWGGLDPFVPPLQAKLDNAAADYFAEVDRTLHSYQQAKKAVEYFEKEYVGQNQAKLWEFCVQQSILEKK